MPVSRVGWTRGAKKAKFKQDHIASRNTFLIDPQGKIRKVYTMVDPTPHSKTAISSESTSRFALRRSA